MASAGQSSPPSSSDLKLPAPVAGKPHLLCSYCAKHNFAITEAFLAKSAEHCKSCGVDTEKENKKAAAAQAAAAQRSAAWGVTLPAEFVTTLGSNGNPSAIGRRTSHSPTVHGAWLPSWLLVAASSRGVSFDDPAVPAKTTMAASAEVASLWRRAMPRSTTCWDIDIAFRCVVFDTATGAAAGACYFDPRNKYVPCVAVDSPFRRRGLGKLLVVAAVAVIESVNATVKADGAGGSHATSSGNGAGALLPGLLSGVRPHLCVSPKDLESSPHLHEFYTALGFLGGRADRGGNYTLGESEAAALLAKFTTGGGGGGGGASRSPLGAGGAQAPPVPPAPPPESTPAPVAAAAAEVLPTDAPLPVEAPSHESKAPASTVAPPPPAAAPAAPPVKEAPKKSNSLFSAFGFGSSKSTTTSAPAAAAAEPTSTATAVSAATAPPTEEAPASDPTVASPSAGRAEASPVVSEPTAEAAAAPSPPDSVDAVSAVPAAPEVSAVPAAAATAPLDSAFSAQMSGDNDEETKGVPSGNAIPTAVEPAPSRGGGKKKKKSGKK